MANGGKSATTSGQPQDMQSVLSNQQRIMTHLMSLDECDLATPVENAAMG